MEEIGWGRGERIELAQAALVAALVAVAGLGWLLTDERMAGMDMGPGTDPGSLAFYSSVWVVMMAAMMLPSAAPMVVAHSAVERRKRELGRDRKRGVSAAFVGGYLLVWTAFGIVAYALFELLRSLDVEALSWSRGGPYAAAAVIAIAAIYQLSPLKDVCLAKCRSPLAFVVGSGLMATLFAVGVMSITWAVVIAVLVALEKLLPWERVANRGVGLLLIALAVGVAVAPEQVPGLTIPGA
jgi:predicted metal-binding membrane protein